jgi:hypothetical protein
MIKTRFVNQQELFEVPLPQRTDSYTPISNREIVDLIHEEAIRNNLTILNTSFKVNGLGTQTIGYFDIQSDDSDMGMRGLFKNSYDKSMSFGFALGTTVWVCSNGCISGEVVTKRKHTGDADDEVKYKIIEGFSMIGDTFESIKQARDRFKSIEVTPRLNAELVGRMFMEHEFINSVQLNIIKKECENSDKFTTIWEPGYSAWDLYNNVTHSLKESHPSSYMHDHIDLHQFMMEQFK